MIILYKINIYHKIISNPNEKKTFNNIRLQKTFSHKHIIISLRKTYIHENYHIRQRHLCRKRKYKNPPIQHKTHV